jgi:hypothetical protein
MAAVKHQDAVLMEAFSKNDARLHRLRGWSEKQIE